MSVFSGNAMSPQTHHRASIPSLINFFVATLILSRCGKACPLQMLPLSICGVVERKSCCAALLSDYSGCHFKNGLGTGFPIALEQR
jgi:hypothetical protein